ncbi:MAG: ABC transporter ATP-binding protein [Deltaproteobacteria bacterium]|nr:ABC transporter ATP-binding protein [Deltaproteobacteria bacterium]MBM4323780.1 ABC transporter ATP-binding protein [Deltaproteobacteria bacterium]
MEEPKKTIIKVVNLSKSFGGVKALRNVSFDLLEGEVLGIIGPNGSGKTTMVNTITGFVKPESGDVFFKDIRLTGLPPYQIADLGVARTFQVVRPFLSLRSFKNLIVPLWSRRARRFAGSRGGDRDAVAIDLLEEVGFERDAYVPYKAASALPLGYLKRLELARCLALRPEVIICDEVFSGLSMSEIASMVPLIERLRMRGVTLIMIEHRLRELFSVANKVIVLNFGEKLAEGKPDQVMQDEKVRRAYLGEEIKL